MRRLSRILRCKHLGWEFPLLVVGVVMLKRYIGNLKSRKSEAFRVEE
jgi:hypothetical protein